MMTRHWQISILKEGRHVRLFLTTTSSMIDTDLRGDPDSSLIRRARQFHRHGQDDEQNHRDLAIGAIMAFASSAPYDISDTHVASSEAAPQTDADHRVGGKHGELVPIWEEPAEIDAWKQPG
jgi:hypothetical protein